jgi:hypothetical protein
MVRRLKLDFWMAYNQTEQSILDRGYNPISISMLSCVELSIREMFFFSLNS